MDIDHQVYKILTDDQKKAVEAAQTPEELLALAKEVGYELSPEQLENVAGGKGKWCFDHCPSDTCTDDCALYTPR